ncbi:solute carrier family 2, facilitated glucose transporter member 5 isoform X2 [Vombatus ursinus]|uniref:solute carrier family 2, facilitated glucose transporter member 5 isoform X2 n=1 Tax=Vombatus ursinus TaxID=29139 RepID=UPI000FFCE383|nr:solute carrier family 2, facilitated glucose transporter member 5 isoform X2 [Vombatus ursinus]
MCTSKVSSRADDPGRFTLILGLVTLVATFGSSFQYGYNVAVVNSPSEIMQNFYNETYYKRNSEYMSSTAVTLLWSVTVSMFPLGGFIGSLMVAPMVNKCGRKGTLLINNIFSIVPAILMGCSKVAGSFEMIIFARIVVGICAGLSSNVVPMYLGELAPKNLRGAICVVPQLFITAGILIAQIFGLRSILTSEEESPRYTLIQKGDEEGAREALKKLRNSEDVEAEVEEIRMEDEMETAAGRVSVLKLFATKSLRWQLISIIVLMAGQQLSGVNAVYYYADQIYREAGVNDQDVQYVTVGTGAVNVVITFLAIFIVERLGRRLLILIGFSICCLACVVLTVALSLQNTVAGMPYVSIACVFSYVVGHAIGPSPIPSLTITEIFLQSSRPAAFMVGGTVHWLSNFAVGLIFPFIQDGLGAYSFIIFGVICLLATIYTFFIVPETKAKTFMEINLIFAKINKVSEVQPEKQELQDFKPSAAL